MGVPVTRAIRQTAAPWRARLVQPWLVAILFICWYLLRLPAQWEYDSYGVYLGSRHVLDWLSGRTQVLSDVGPYPLMQYLSGVSALWAASHGIPINIFWLWSALNTIGLAGIAAVLYRAAGRTNRPELFWAMLVVILSGPLVAYEPTTFNELFAAFLAVAFTDAVTANAAPILCAILFWLSGITKETAAPLLLVIWLGALCMRAPQARPRNLAVHVFSLLSAFIITVATNAAFNLLRFHSAWNTQYLTPYFFVGSLHRRMQYCIALWLAPNGGVLMFWPTLALFTAGVLVIGLPRRRITKPAIIVAIVLGAMTLMLSGWYSPFGWWAWGPRLLLPWLPAAALLLLKGDPVACANWIGRLLTRPRAFIATAAITCLCALPHILETTDSDVVEHFFESDRRFPHGAPVSHVDAQYANNMYLAWQKLPPLLVRPAMEYLTFSRIVPGLAFAAALVVLLWKCREEIVYGLLVRKRAPSR